MRHSVLWEKLAEQVFRYLSILKYLNILKILKYFQRMIL